MQDLFTPDLFNPDPTHWKYLTGSFLSLSQTFQNIGECISFVYEHHQSHSSSHNVPHPPYPSQQPGLLASCGWCLKPSRAFEQFARGCGRFSALFFSDYGTAGAKSRTPYSRKALSLSLRIDQIFHETPYSNVVRGRQPLPSLPFGKNGAPKK